MRCQARFASGDGRVRAGVVELTEDAAVLNFDQASRLVVSGWLVKNEDRQSPHAPVS